MINHSDLSDKELYRALRLGVYQWAGNKGLKIYGRLGCRSGKRMKRENRVFFRNEEEATQLGYRPCKICMKVRKQDSPGVG